MRWHEALLPAAGDAGKAGAACTRRAAVASCAGSGGGDRLMLQTAFNGVVTGIIMTLPALAVTLLFGVLKFPNFAVGAMMTVAAYMTFALNAQLGWPLALSTVVVAAAFGALLIAIDYVTFRPLRERGGSL
jgi:branched-subunit amino acid ABC-type transport system permease component